MNETARILCAISYTEPCTFNEFLDGLGTDRPDNNEWRSFFLVLESLEAQKLITIKRFAGKGRIETLQLTPLGAERAREAQQEARR